MEEGHRKKEGRRHKDTKRKKEGGRGHRERVRETDIKKEGERYTDKEKGRGRDTGIKKGERENAFVICMRVADEVSVCLKVLKE